MKNFLLLITLTLLSVISLAATYYVSPTGSDSNPGTITSPFKTLDKLNAVLSAGDIGYLRGGTYTSAKGNGSGLHFGIQDLSGSSSNPIIIQAYPGETPVFDLSNITPTNSYPYAMGIFNCNYVQLKGKIVVKNLKQIDGGAGISRGFGINNSDNCRIENVEVYNCNYGFLIEEGSDDNLFLNCDAHHNGDGVSDGGADAWDNADGFGCTSNNTLPANTSTRNTFDGCRAWMNSDDGWDFFGVNGVFTLKNCQSFWNGIKPWGTSATQPTEAGMTNVPYTTWHNNGSYIAGSGEGFKLGPARNQDFNTIGRYVQNCVSFENRGTGYSANSDGALTQKMQFLNNISYKNDNDGFSFAAGWASGVAHIFKNNWAWSNNQAISGGDMAYDGLGTNMSNNVWMTTYGNAYGNLSSSASVSSADFLSVSSVGVDAARQSNGSLPTNNYLKLTSTSDLINKGVNVGLAYQSSAPDLGAFESGGGSTNQAPTANAGIDQAITLPTSTVTLTGSGTDADGTISAYTWVKTSGPANGTITSSTAATTTVTALVQGTYQFQLTVSDNAGATHTDVVQVIVNAAPVNTPPVANAGTDKTTTLPTSTVSLTGSGTDAGGSIAAYAWTKVSGPTGGTIATASVATTNITALIQGVYKFELKVTDNLGAIGRDTVQVTVNALPVNAAPVANAGADKIITLPTVVTTLTGSGTDTDGTIATYTWTKVSGPTGGLIGTLTAAVTAITGLLQGVYKYELKVTDNAGAIGRDTVQVTVNPVGVNIAPVANAGADKTITLPANSVSLTGSGADADGTIASYAWSKYSGPTGGTITTSTAATTTITALIQGTYKYILKVTDNGGAIGRDTVQITVNPVGTNTPPVANAGADKTVTLPASTVSLAGSGTDDNGTIASYAWTKVSGPTGGTIATATAATTNVTALIQGVYKFELKVTDNGGAIGRDTVQVTVNAVVDAGNAYGGVRWAIPGKVEAENYDNGGNNVAYYDNTNGNNGASYRTSEMVDITTSSEGGYLVGWIVAGEWMKYSVNIATSGTYTLTARVASGVTGNTFLVQMDGATVATVTVPNTGGSQSWQTVTVNNVSLAAGARTMRIYALGTSFNINFVEFASTLGAKGMFDESMTAATAITPAVGTTVNTFPMPFSTSFTANINGDTMGKYSLNLVNVSGNVVWKKEINKTTASVNETIYMGNLPDGVYILQVVSPDKKVTTQQIVKD